MRYHELEEDRPICEVNKEEKCSDFGCKMVPVQKCRVEKITTRKGVPETSCKRIPVKSCRQEKCETVRCPGKVANSTRQECEMKEVEVCRGKENPMCQTVTRRSCTTVKRRIFSHGTHPAIQFASHDGHLDPTLYEVKEVDENDLLDLNLDEDQEPREDDDLLDSFLYEVEDSRRANNLGNILSEQTDGGGSSGAIITHAKILTVI